MIECRVGPGVVVPDSFLMRMSLEIIWFASPCHSEHIATASHVFSLMSLSFSSWDEESVWGRRDGGHCSQDRKDECVTVSFPTVLLGAIFACLFIYSRAKWNVKNEPSLGTAFCSEVTAVDSGLCQAVPSLAAVLVSHQGSCVLWLGHSLYRAINPLHDKNANCYPKNPRKEVVGEDSPQTVNLGHWRIYVLWLGLGVSIAQWDLVWETINQQWCWKWYSYHRGRTLGFWGC